MRNIPCAEFGLRSDFSQPRTIILGKSDGYCGTAFSARIDLSQQDVTKKLTNFMEEVKANHLAQGLGFDYLVFLGLDMKEERKANLCQSGHFLFPIETDILESENIVYSGLVSRETTSYDKVHEVLPFPADSFPGIVTLEDMTPEPFSQDEVPGEELTTSSDSGSDISGVMTPVEVLGEANSLYPQIFEKDFKDFTSSRCENEEMELKFLVPESKDTRGPMSSEGRVEHDNHYPAPGQAKEQPRVDPAAFYRSAKAERIYIWGVRPDDVLTPKGKKIRNLRAEDRNK